MRGPACDASMEDLCDQFGYSYDFVYRYYGSGGEVEAEAPEFGCDEFDSEGVSLGPVPFELDLVLLGLH